MTAPTAYYDGEWLILTETGYITETTRGSMTPCQIAAYKRAEAKRKRRLEDVPARIRRRIEND